MDRWRLGLARARQAGRFGPLVRFGDGTPVVVRDFTVAPMGGGQQAPLPPGGYDVGAVTQHSSPDPPRHPHTGTYLGPSTAPPSHTHYRTRRRTPSYTLAPWHPGTRACCRQVQRATAGHVRHRDVLRCRQRGRGVLGPAGHPHGPRHRRPGRHPGSGLRRRSCQPRQSPPAAARPRVRRRRPRALNGPSGPSAPPSLSCSLAPPSHVALLWNHISRKFLALHHPSRRVARLAQRQRGSGC